MTKSPAGVGLTPSAYAIARLAATCASLVFAAGCGGKSPTAADGPMRHRIEGMVTNEVLRPLWGATIHVLDGPMARTPPATTDDSGRFELYSTTPGTVTLQVNRAGFKSAIHTAEWHPASNREVEVIRLESYEKPAFQFDPGDYTVTISMDPAAARDFGGRLPPCAGFPAELMSRTYRATIAESSHSSSDKIVSLEGPTVFSNAQFGLLIGPHFIGFEMQDFFTEELPGFKYLNIMGGAPTDEPVTASGPAVSIPISAQFQYCELDVPARPGWGNCQHAAALRFHVCFSDSARMVFTRR